MKTYSDCISLTKGDFKNGHYTGPFEISQLVNCDVEIQGELGTITLNGGLQTTGRISVGPETELRVLGPISAKSLLTQGDVYATHLISVGSLKVKGNLVCEMQIQVTKSFYVGGRIVTPRLVLSSLDIQMPQRYHWEHKVPKKG